MPSQFTLDSLEILGFSMLAVMAVGSVVFSVVGTLTFLLTREPAAHAAPKVAPTAHPVAARQSGRVPTAIAG